MDEPKTPEMIGFGLPFVEDGQRIQRDPPQVSRLFDFSEKELNLLQSRFLNTLKIIPLTKFNKPSSDGKMFYQIIFSPETTSEQIIEALKAVYEEA